MAHRGPRIHNHVMPQEPSVIIGGSRPLNGKVILVPYDPSWPSLYDVEEKRLRGVLGSQALLIEHTGSTSVPGLCAKPIIDMLLVVLDSADEGTYLPHMEAAGYILRVREPDWHEHRMFKGPGADINLHVFSAGNIEIDRILRFRDWLRNHADDRELYAVAKRKLAEREWQFVQDYADAKSEVVEDIIARSRRFEVPRRGCGT